jgi:hypothetical protein
MFESFRPTEEVGVEVEAQRQQQHEEASSCTPTAAIFNNYLGDAPAPSLSMPDTLQISRR